MMTIEALRLHHYGQDPDVRLDILSVEAPASGQVMIDVKAAGLNPIDEKIATGVMPDVIPVTLPVILGIEISGEICMVGEGVSSSFLGQKVIAPTGSFGAFAGKIVLPVSALTFIPSDLDEILAAALPVAGLTAWQALFEHGKLQRGERVIVHGAAGAVGSFAVQLAAQAGATVIGTGSQRNFDYIKALGAQDIVLNGTTADHIDPVDLIIDLVGRDLEPLVSMLKENGRIVSTVSPDLRTPVSDGVESVFFQMKPDPERLSHLALLAATGALRITISRRWNWNEAPIAFLRRSEGRPGKAIILGFDSRAPEA